MVDAALSLASSQGAGDAPAPGSQLREEVQATVEQHDEQVVVEQDRHGPGGRQVHVAALGDHHGLGGDEGQPEPEGAA